MDAAKIQALIAELKSDIKIKQQAIEALNNLLSMAPKDNSLENIATISRNVGSGPVSPISFSDSDSYVDLAVKVIAANNYRPLPMKEIVKHIRLLKASPDIERRSVEATLFRHIKTKGENSRVLKVSPGVYGARRIPREAAIG